LGRTGRELEVSIGGVAARVNHRRTHQILIIRTVCGVVVV